MPGTYSSDEVCQQAEITYKQLDYMIRTGYLTPSVPAAGSGSSRRYSEEDLETVMLTAKLLELGVDWEQLRRDRNPRRTLVRMSKALRRLEESVA